MPKTETLIQTTKRMREHAGPHDDGFSWMTPQERETHRWNEAMRDAESDAFAAMGY